MVYGARCMVYKVCSILNGVCNTYLIGVAIEPADIRSDHGHAEEVKIHDGDDGGAQVVPGSGWGRMWGYISCGVTHGVCVEEPTVPYTCSAHIHIHCIHIQTYIHTIQEHTQIHLSHIYSPLSPVHFALCTPVDTKDDLLSTNGRCWLRMAYKALYVAICSVSPYRLWVLYMVTLL